MLRTLPGCLLARRAPVSACVRPRVRFCGARRGMTRKTVRARCAPFVGRLWGAPSLRYSRSAPLGRMPTSPGPRKADLWLCGERRRSGVSAPCRLRRGAGCGACADEVGQASRPAIRRWLPVAASADPAEGENARTRPGAAPAPPPQKGSPSKPSEAGSMGRGGAAK